MTLETILITYLKFNLLTLASYFLWDIAQAMQNKFFKHQSAIFQLYVARIFFVSPLALPLAIAWLSLSSPSGELVPAEDYLISTAFVGVEVTILICLMLLAGIVINVSKLWREQVALRELIIESEPLKKIGNVSVVFNTKIKIPFATGFFRRKYIVLPESILLSRRNLHIILKHEGRHIRTGDLYWSLFSRLNSVLCFWNPATYAWRELLHDLQELACDEYVTKQTDVSPDAYARCLLRVAAFEHYEQYSLITPMSLWRHSLRHGAPNLKNRIELLYLETSDGVVRHYLPALAMAGMFIASLLFFGTPQSRAYEFQSEGALQSSNEAGLLQENALGNNQPVLAPTFQPDAFWGMLNK